ncbi:UvrD-helicase domain-containing protein [Pseudomonas aeruginosa]|uniref:UvrD-helicase domain-containing protein n=1 Tax=Pseudomonas aeruginosa TaxID=287 RepID=UPI001378CA44
MSLEGLDEGQYAAAAHNDGRHGLASAGPGSGKTKTVIAHVGELLRRGGNPKAIQVLAFSADAVEEFSKRLIASGAPGGGSGERQNAPLARAENLWVDAAQRNPSRSRPADRQGRQ